MDVRLAAAALFAMSMISAYSDSDTIPDGDPGQTFGGSAERLDAPGRLILA
jgi:hypothetical protein